MPSEAIKGPWFEYGSREWVCVGPKCSTIEAACRLDSVGVGYVRINSTKIEQFQTLYMFQTACGPYFVGWVGAIIIAYGSRGLVCVGSRYFSQDPTP